MVGVSISSAVIYRKAVEISKSSPALAMAFKKYREDSRKLSRPITIDVSSRCNLFCEGCYYFEGDASKAGEVADESAWRDFFQQQQASGVKYCYLGGAEPAVYPERLQLASEHIPWGSIAANGTIKIDPSIPFRVVVSVWGDEYSTERLRGGGTFWKAIKNYGDDPRALFVYTITRQNMDEMRRVAEIMRDVGAQMTFNMFSPTTSYLQKLSARAANDKQFFRISTVEDNLCFTDSDLLHCREAVAELIDDFPGTIVYPHAYNREVTEPGSIFDLDPLTGWADNCAGRHNGTHHTYLSSLQKSAEKCCMPNIDCTTCRHNVAYLVSRLSPRERDVQSPQSVKDWLEICHYWAWLYLGEKWTPLQI